MKKRYIVLIIVLIAAGWYLLRNSRAEAPTSETKSATTTSDSTTNQNNSNNPKEKTLNNLQFPGILPAGRIENKKAVIETAKGTISIDLYADKAPKTVSNFVYLAEKGYYDGLTFHRVVPGFVIQGGDPNGTGTGGPGYKFPDEPVVGDYLDGTVAMANSGPDTNGSQFFICLGDQKGLPKQYNLFGQVTVGLDVIGKIAVGDKMTKVTIENK